MQDGKYTRKFKKVEPVVLNHKQEVLIDDLHRCCLCGHDLDLQHKFDYNQLLVTELASCPQCQIRMRHKSFTLH